jgi:hypothetical protein
MSRIRTLKPEILEDAKTSRLSDACWRTFVSLILLADDHGNLHAEPDRLEAAIFWGSRDPRDTFANILETLASVSLVEFYEVRGQRFAHIVGWDRHQKVDKPSRPRVPRPCDVFAGPSRDPRETLDIDLRSPTSDLRPPTSDQGARDRARARTTGIRPRAETETQSERERELDPGDDNQVLTPQLLGEVFAETWARVRETGRPKLPAPEQLEEFAARVVETAAARDVQPVTLVRTALEQWAGSKLNEREVRTPYACFETAWDAAVDSVAPPGGSASTTTPTKRLDEMRASMRALNGGAR